MAQNFLLLIYQFLTKKMNIFYFLYQFSRIFHQLIDFLSNIIDFSWNAHDFLYGSRDFYLNFTISCKIYWFPKKMCDFHKKLLNLYLFAFILLIFSKMDWCGAELFFLGHSLPISWSFGLVVVRHWQTPIAPYRGPKMHKIAKLRFTLGQKGLLRPV